jgi:hypothetical protein
MGFQHRNNLVNDGELLAYSVSILNKWKNCFIS